MKQIQVIIPSKEGNACPSRNAFRQLATERLFEVAKSEGHVPQGATTWPFQVELTLRPALNGGYEVTGEFEPTS